MKRDVVRDFLNLPGIVGIALVDGRSRPFFFGIDQTLNFQQKEALAQGIQQVVETTPSNFESFEFQFSGYQVFIYKLENGIILLVLTNEQLVYSSYSLLVSELKSDLQEDLGNAIANFRLAAGNVTLSGQKYWKRQPDSGTATISTELSVAPDKPSPTQPSKKTRFTPSSPTVTQRNGQPAPTDAPKRTSSPTTPPDSSQVPSAGSKPPPADRSNPVDEEAARPTLPNSPPSTPKANAARAAQIQAARERAARQRQAPGTASSSDSRTNRPRVSPLAAAPQKEAPKPVPQNTAPTQNFTSPSKKPADQEGLAAKTGNTGNAPTSVDKPITLKEILEALNQLSKLTTRYLGTSIVANYWKSSRPPVEWLANFEVDRSGKIEFVGPMTPGKPPVLSSVQHQLIRDWVNAFVQRCSRVIRDFSKIIQSMDLDPHQRSLLLPKDN